MTDDRVGTFFGPYRIDDLIGRGGMGEVYRAYDTVKDREVALKLLPRELAGDTAYRERFEREARVAARLQEPHVIPIHDFGRIDDVLYMDMRLVRGKDLRTVLRRPEQMNVAFAVELVRQMSDALEAAHADGLVHRDVKPENILMLPSGFAYLADFGIAARADEARMTSAGTAIGSFAYMAPERFQDAPVSPASDIYSLGCVLYECLAGRPPFPRGSVPAMIQAHLNETPVPLSAIRDDVPPALDAVVRRAMAKNPAHRFADAGEFGRAATAALGQSTDARRTDSAVASGMSAGHPGPAFNPRPPHESATSVPLAGGLTQDAATRGGYSGGNGYSSGDRGGNNRGTGASGGYGTDSRRDRRRSRAALIGALAAVVLLAGLVAWQALGRSNQPADAGPGTGTSSTSSSSSSGAQSSSPTSTSPTTSTTTSTSVSTGANGHTTTVTVTRTQTASASSTSAPTSSTSSGGSSPTWAAVLPDGPGYDWQGWTDYAVLRCGGDDRAAMVASTGDSLVTICESHSGSTYYLGLRPNQTVMPNSLRLANPVPSDGGWLARSSTGTYSYLVTSSSLTISNANTGDSRSEPVSTYAAVD